MKTKSRLNVILMIGVVLAGVAGCSFSREATGQRSAQVRQRNSTLSPERRHQLAVERVIQGSVYDATGEYANAILEYQEALRLEPTAAVQYMISRDYSLLGKHALAAQHAREAVRLDSLNILYRQNLATVYMNAYQPELAAAQYEQILKIDSTKSDVWYSLARIYQSSRPLRALEIYERILDREGDDWELLYQTAEIYTSLGRFDDAAEKYKRMVELDPSNRALQRQLAGTYGRSGKTREALAILENLLEVDENDAETLATLADVYLEQQDFPKALKYYQRLLAMERTNPEVRLRVGVAYVGQMQRDSTFIGKAKPVFEQLKRDLPNDWRPYYYLGMIAERQRKDSLAASYFEQVTRLAEWNGDAWWYIGSSYFEKGEYEKLAEAMQRAAKAIPKDHRVHFLLGLANSRMERHDEAITALRRALELKPDDLNALSTLALELDGLHRYQESDSLYEQALRVDSTYHLILNNYAYSLSERGLQLERALQMSLRAIASDPTNPSYLDTVGWVYFKLGNYEEAREYIAKAIAAGEASATVYEHMGDILFSLGKRTEAEKYWNDALKMNANNEALKQKIARGKL